MIGRREFVAGVGSTAACAWSVVAGAQQPDRMRRIGVLLNYARNDPNVSPRLEAFEKGLQELSWSVGRNIQIDYRFGAGDPDLFRKYAAELVALAPEVILAQGSVAVQPLLEVTRVLPIVFVGTVDPIGRGFAASLARPGGNATGFVLFEYGLAGKWLGLLKQIAPRVTRVAVMRDPLNPNGTGQFGAIQSVAPSFGVELTPIGVRDTGEIESRHYRLCRPVEWRPNSDIEHLDKSASRSDHHADGPSQAPHRLPISLLCHRRRPDFLRA